MKEYDIIDFFYYLLWWHHHRKYHAYRFMH